MINKHEFIKQLIQNCNVTPDPEPAAFFMAGLPGSGKTEISKNLIIDSGVNLLRIDMDEIAERLPGYKPNQADEFRKPATTLLSECFSYALHHNISFIMDGTFGNGQALKNIERSLKHGFRVKIIYALQDPKAAWQFTVAREKIEHRAIRFDGFVETYYKTIRNIKAASDIFTDQISIDIAIKNTENKVEKWKRNVKSNKIDSLVNVEYNKDKLIKYILGA